MNFTPATLAAQFNRMDIFSSVPLSILKRLAVESRIEEFSFDAIVLHTTTHLAIGALMLAIATILTLRAYRLSEPSPFGRPSRKVLAEQLS